MFLEVDGTFSPVGGGRAGTWRDPLTGSGSGACGMTFLVAWPARTTATGVGGEAFQRELSGGCRWPKIDGLLVR